MRPICQREIQCKYNYVVSRFASIALRLKESYCHKLLQLRDTKNPNTISLSRIFNTSDFDNSLPPTMCEVEPTMKGPSHAPLEYWYQKKIHWPYPSKQNVTTLSQQSGMSEEEVRKWFSSRRKLDKEGRKGKSANGSRVVSFGDSHNDTIASSDPLASSEGLFLKDAVPSFEISESPNFPLKRDAPNARAGKEKRLRVKKEMN